jgi:hypothetical protein
MAVKKSPNQYYGKMIIFSERKRMEETVTSARNDFLCEWNQIMFGWKWNFF